MKVVTMVAGIDAAECTGCMTCERVCPVLAVKVKERKAVVDPERCRGCGNCEQRCPARAVTMGSCSPRHVGVSVSDVDYARVEELCRKAKLHPEQVICYCTASRAEEAAQAILLGAHSPEDISLATGIRTGCKVECIQPMLRLLEAAGIEASPPAGGYQWYGRTVTAWEIPQQVREKYAARGFYFADDLDLFEKLLKRPLQRRGGRE
jgi:NAD-dependent dihydropyrimidine dehydrogenase PreA subunit/bacterioferritin-associated ferredoxin